MTNQTDDAAPASPSAIRRHAFVFPGQGSQYVGMGADLVESTPAAAAVLERADAALGFPLSTLIPDGPAEDLGRTVNAPPPLPATSTPYPEALRGGAAGGGVQLGP